MILVTKIALIDEKTVIHFDTKYGKGFGFWKGETAPIINEYYFVECDIYEKVILNDNLFKTDEKETKIYNNNVYMYLVGKINTKRDSFADFNFADMCMCIEIDEKQCVEDVFYELKTKELYIFPFDY